MKTQKSTIKKVFGTVAALMLFTAAQAQAGSVTLNGAIDWIEDNDSTGVQYSDLVSLELNWLNDAVINPVGGSELQLNPAWGNTFTFTIGDLTLTNATLQGETPVAHFENGILDGFQLNWFESSFTSGASGNSWSFYASGFAADGDPDIFWEIMDESSFTGDWFEGHLDSPEAGTPSAVPVPGAVWVLGSGLIGLVGLRRKVRE